MAQGGKRPGAGRPLGARNKRTVELSQAVEASGLTPIDYMIAVMRDESQDTSTRLDAAKAAAPYLHPKLTASDVSLSMQEAVEPMTDAEYRGRLSQMLHENPELRVMMSEALAGN